MLVEPEMTEPMSSDVARPNQPRTNSTYHRPIHRHLPDESPPSVVGGTVSRILPPLSPAIVALIAEFRRRLVEHWGDRLIRLTLFGSYARGDARPDSDVDLAVVVDRIDSYAERLFPMELAGDLTVEYELVIMPIVLSVAELSQLHLREDLLAENLEREGIEV